MSTPKESNNYVTISKPSDRVQLYAYIDAEDLSAEEFFIRHGIHVDIIQ